MMINNFSDVVDKFQFSWASAGVLTVGMPFLDQLFPVVSQLVLICGVQLITIGVDYFRQKYKIKRSKRDKSGIDVIDSGK